MKIKTSGIISALLKSQQTLQKQIEQANSINNEQDKIIISLRNEIIGIKEKYALKEEFKDVQNKLNKINETYRVFDEELAKSKFEIK